MMTPTVRVGAAIAPCLLISSPLCAQAPAPAIVGDHEHAVGAHVGDQHEAARRIDHGRMRVRRGLARMRPRAHRPSDARRLARCLVGPDRQGRHRAGEVGGQQTGAALPCQRHCILRQCRLARGIARNVEPDQLMVALKGAPEEVLMRFLDNMSERARGMFRDDMEAKGPQRMADVEDAQKQIMRKARKLSDSGELILGGADFV